MPVTERCLCMIDEELKSIEDFYNKEFPSSIKSAKTIYIKCVVNSLNKVF